MNFFKIGCAKLGVRVPSLIVDVCSCWNCPIRILTPSLAVAVWLMLRHGRRRSRPEFASVIKIILSLKEQTDKALPRLARSDGAGSTGAHGSWLWTSSRCGCGDNIIVALPAISLHVAGSGKEEALLDTFLRMRNDGGQEIKRYTSLTPGYTSE